MQQRLFRAQMNPHFTSNILYSIQNLNKANTEKANSYLIKFSRLLRLILENSMQNYVAIDKEIDVLTKYLDLQQLRFPKKFEYHIKMYNLDEDSAIKIPPMLIQPFVENAIEHAFRNINYKGILNISLDINKKFIICKIEDNGIGIKKSNKNNNSTSTKLIADLLNNMTKKSIQIIDKEVPKSGTIIIINIPYKESF